MSARVTSEEVREVVSTELSDNVILTNMIDTANAVVDTHLLAAGVTEKILTKIELYLAAHFVALTEEGGGITRSKMGDADESYANVYEAGFKSTRYGQMALSLDFTGLLAAGSQTSLTAQFRVV